MKDISGLRNDFTATGYVLNPARTKMLMVFHKTISKWLPPGGHLEKNEVPHEAALREVFEETGLPVRLSNDTFPLQLVSETESQIPSPLCIIHEIIPPSHKDVEHLHVDFNYVLESDEIDPSSEIDGTSTGAKWMTKEEVLACDTYPGVKAVASKLLL